MQTALCNPNNISGEAPAQIGIAPPRIGNIDEVLRELRGNQAHLTTPKVHLTKEKYTPSEAMEKVENIATLMDVAMDKDLLERYVNIKIYPFFISPKALLQELIDALENLGADDHHVCFKIDREKRTLNPISKSQYDGLNFNEKGRLLRGVLEGINEGRLLYTGFDSTGLWVNYLAYNEGVGPLQVAFTESTD